jgi:uncharacterized membrane protein
MAPLIVFIVSFTIVFLLDKFFLKRLSLSFKGRFAMAVMLIFTSIAHFTHTEEMVQMLPDFLSLKKEIVYFTGAIELAASVGLLIPKLSRLTSILLILFFIAILPANVIGSIKQVNLGGMQNGTGYLFFRIPLQLFFIGWTYYFGIKINKAFARQ